MASIPKKAVDRFLKAVPKFQKVLQIAKDRDINESDTVSVLNDILAEVFGYDKYLEVTSEFMIRGTYCDLALKVEDKIQFLVEAKAIGIDLKEAHIKQTVDYGANHGVQWVVLTNGITWRVYRIRFEQPINHDLVCSFDFTALNARDDKDQELLFTLAKEGLDRSAREQFYDKVQSINRYVVGSLILSEPVLAIIRRELKKLSDGVRIEVDEVEEIVRIEVLKREVVEGELAEAAQARVNKFYRKSVVRRRQNRAETIAESPMPDGRESLTERLLREAGEQEVAGEMS
jgi:predicted type IV restriction endonuclease